MPDSVRRAIRSFIQGFIAVAALQAGALMADADDGALDFALWKRAGLTALVAGVFALVSFVQNWLEDAGTIPSVLKANASSGAKPITQDPAK